MGSFSIPLSGLLSSEEDLGIISNNLANLNTTGFKGSSANFSDLVYEQLGTSGTGHPIQTGLGTQVGSTSIDFTQGSIQSTGVDTDVAIQGNGFLQVQNNGLTLYTRNGNLSVSSQGYLVAQDGSQVMGFEAVNGTVNPGGSTVPLQISPGQTVPAQATSTVELNLNLDASSSTGSTFSAPVSVYDSLGNSHVLTFNFTNNGGNSWSYTATLPAADVTASPAPSGPVTVGSGTLQFSNTGTLTSPTTNPTLTLPAGYTLADSAQTPSITWELTDPATQTLGARQK